MSDTIDLTPQDQVLLVLPGLALLAKHLRKTREALAMLDLLGRVPQLKSMATDAEEWIERFGGDAGSDTLTVPVVSCLLSALRLRLDELLALKGTMVARGFDVPVQLNEALDRADTLLRSAGDQGDWVAEASLAEVVS